MAKLRAFGLFFLCFQLGAFLPQALQLSVDRPALLLHAFARQLTDAASAGDVILQTEIVPWLLKIYFCIRDSALFFGQFL